MKQRVLVMNGSRIVQNERDGQWYSDKVDKAGALKPGIYNLYLANRADKTATCSGVILHADKEHVYQQVGKNYVMHARSDFDKVPEIGSAKSISYDAQGKASVSAETVQLSRGRSR
ncbi:IncP plasmid survival protein KfrB [Aromatoleum anaerobium]|uniref:Conjugal transfer protein TraO n=1 Tax=Aromatoleum anaerobium TaxID=182180 RepID=A0ABX1PPJ4_9RHOO|nr:IncP plasmid survival protein KfrB [Aromatoleum anaerobium]MCK0505289.1 conjugal transfer protein TraO [Aromatoleum anaerobium]